MNIGFLGVTRALFYFGIISLYGCASQPIELHSKHGELYSPSMGRVMSYSVYTPPDWSPDESLPLMLLLHGARDNHQTFDKYKVGQHLDKEASERNLPRVIVLSPDGELGFWENWHDGSHLYRDWVVKDLMPYVAETYNTLPCPDACFVTGISMGAHGALRFAYYEKQTFGSVAALSGPIISKRYPGESSLGRTIMMWLLPTERIWGDIESESSHVPKDLDPYISWIKRPDLVDLPLLLAWGSEESKSIKNSNEHFHKYLLEHNKPHEYLVFDGGHKWVAWREVMDDVIRFHMLSSHFQ
ncbi:alpha/beta hydrolase [Alteromonas flava]|uniref:alpha/beta hydrolase n=1 Tax=Alteromonas flava TaxID=2048003 RepID=UPI00196AA113|nr:alpha/beta hydrolase-fold protein [Alteromonas flava]